MKIINYICIIITPELQSVSFFTIGLALSSSITDLTLFLLVINLP